jgi:hypothetical protein
MRAKVHSPDLTRDRDWYRSLPRSLEKLRDEESMMAMLALAKNRMRAKVHLPDLTRDWDWYRSLLLSSEKVWDEELMMVILVLA